MDADEPTTPTLPGMEHLAPVAVVKDDASPTVRRTARRRIMLEAGLNPATARPLLPAVFGRTCGDVSTRGPDATRPPHERRSCAGPGLSRPRPLTSGDAAM